MLQVTGINHRVVERGWQGGRPFVVGALEDGQGEMTIGDVLMLLGERKMQLWVVHDGENVVAAGVTEIAEFPRRKICICRLFSSKHDNLSEMLPLFQTIKEWAAANGCDGIEVHGRRNMGWARKLPGFEPAYTILREDFRHDHNTRH